MWHNIQSVYTKGLDWNCPQLPSSYLATTNHRLSREFDYFWTALSVCLSILDWSRTLRLIMQNVNNRRSTTLRGLRRLSWSFELLHTYRRVNLLSNHSSRRPLCLCLHFHSCGHSSSFLRINLRSQHESAVSTFGRNCKHFLGSRLDSWGMFLIELLIKILFLSPSQQQVDLFVAH